MSTLQKFAFEGEDPLEIELSGLPTFTFTKKHRKLLKSTNATIRASNQRIIFLNDTQLNMKEINDVF